MADKNSLGRIKDVARGSMKTAATAAESALGLARRAVVAGGAAGGHATKVATKKVASVVTSLAGHTGADPSAHGPAEQDPMQSASTDPSAAGTTTDTPVSGRTPDAEAKLDKKRASQAKKSPASRPEPVNVTDELGLDPAPVEKPKPAKKATPQKPTTKIDAAADPSHVDVTPADIAKSVGKDAPTNEKSTD